LSANDLPGRRTQIFNIHRIRIINHHPVESDEDSAPDSIPDTEYWLNWNWDVDNPNDSEDNCTANFGSNIEQDNNIEDPECPEQQDLSAMPNVP